GADALAGRIGLYPIPAQRRSHRLGETGPSRSHIDSLGHYWIVWKCYIDDDRYDRNPRSRCKQDLAQMTVELTKTGKPKRTLQSIKVERQFANVIRLFLAGELPDFSHQRHVDVANILHHISYGRELMHLGLQTMAHRAYIPHK